MSKYLVVATPRSGTAYTARVLSRLGLDCGHERHLGLAPQLPAFLEAAGTLGESSWLAVPFVDQMPADVRVLHQVRNPLKVIRSMLELQFFDLDAAGQPRRVGPRRAFTEFALRHCPQVLAYKTELERSAWFYYHWNRRIEAHGAQREILRVRLEDLDAQRLGALLRFIGVDATRWTEEQLAAEFAAIPRDTNAKTDEKVILTEAVTWATLPREVCELARAYGYAVDVAPAQVVDGAAEACDAAFEAAREQIYRAQWTWRSEREHQTGVTVELKDEADRLCRMVRELQMLLHAAREQTRAVREHARLAQEKAVAQHRARLEALTTKLQRVSDARRATVQQRDEIRTANQKLRKQLQIAVQARADAEREPELLRQQLELAAHEREALEAAAAEARANWQKGRDEVAVLSASLQATRQELETRTGAIRKLRHALSAAQERQRVTRTRVQWLDTRVRYFKATLECRDEEVRYRLGDALVKALPWPPSWDTLRLPGRLIGLVMEGVKRRRARRSGAATDQRAPRTVPASLPTPSPTPAREGSAATPSTDAARPVETIVREARKPLTAIVPAERNNGNLLATVPPPVPVGERGALSARNRGRSARWGAPGYLFFCVNGAGLGHVTRSLAIARRIRRLEPEAPIYFLSSSQALDVISREGMVAYHIPPHSRYGDHLRRSEWSTLLQQQIQLIADTHHPAVFVYDGVFPYRGVLDAIQECRFVHAAMVLRLRHKHDRLPEMAEKFSVFNELIFPGEAGVRGGVGDLAPPELAALTCRTVDPIVYLDREELLPREQVRALWNVPPDKKLVYVQLGAGNINDIQALSDQILSILTGRKDIVVLLAESPIAERAHNGRANVHVLRHYPNSLYCRGFDLAITAVGYNTFHEQMHFGVPSVLIPNQETKTDDQTGRAMTAHRALAAITVLRLESLAEAIALGLTDAVASTMREKALALVPANGALAAAQCLVEASQPAPGLAVV